MVRTRFPQSAAPAPDPTRRRWLAALGASPALAAGAGNARAAAVKTKAHIVIAGSGLGGIAVANRLSRMLDGARITIVDGKEALWSAGYQRNLEESFEVTIELKKGLNEIRIYFDDLAERDTR